LRSWRGQATLPVRNSRVDEVAVNDRDVRRRFLAGLVVLAALALPVHARAQEQSDPLLQAVLMADAAVDLHYARNYGAAVMRLRSASLLLDAVPESPPRDALREEVRYNLACALAQSGEVDDAVAALEQAVAAGFLDRKHMLGDRDLVPLHKSPRYQALMKSLSRLAELQVAIEQEQSNLAAAGVLAVRSETPLDLDLPRIGGGRLRLKDLRGKVILLDVWGTWCAPCLAALPRVQALAHKRPAQVAVIGLAFEKGQTGQGAIDRVRAVIDAAHLSYPHAIVGAGLLDRLGAQGLPTLALLDKRGRLRWVGGGMPEDEVLNALLDRLVSEDADPAPRQP
jgi:thiol-disulfide isomerase/thioredoxin